MVTMGSWWPPLMLSPFVICDALLGCGESWGWRARWHDLLWSFRSKHFGERPWVQLQAAALPWGFGMIWIWIVVCYWSHPKMIWNDLNKSLHHPKWKESFHKPSLSGKECSYFLRHMPRYTNVLRWIALSMLWGPTSLHGPSHSKRVKLHSPKLIRTSSTNISISHMNSYDLIIPWFAKLPELPVLPRQTCAGGLCFDLAFLRQAEIGVFCLLPSGATLLKSQRCFFPFFSRSPGVLTIADAWR